MRGFRSRSRQRQHSLSLGIPRLKPLERFSSEPGVGFHPIALNQSRQYRQPRRLEKPESQNGETFQVLG